MSEMEMKQGTEINENNNGVLKDGTLDLGSSAANDFDPFGDMSFVEEQIPELEPKEAAKPTTKTNAKVTSSKKEESSDNPLAQAMDVAETKEAEESKKNLFVKLPVFSYAAANEEVDDTSKTFEDLRIEKSADFPELEDGKRVSWTVEYGKVTKVVSNPTGTTIAKMKSDIETSKEFLEALKKSKDKEPVCNLKPKVTAQSKGKVSAYKGVFTSMEDAVASGKVITFIPARDGKVYEMRQNELGKFITPSTGSDMLNDVKAGFFPALPPIPYEHLLDVISFFRMMALKGDYEALVNIYWDKEAENFITDVPEQTVTMVSVDSTANPIYDNDRFVHYMDIHSHNKMKAFFSETDNKDEKATRVYAVLGNVLNYFPEIKVRISNGGSFCEIDPGVVFEDFYYNTDLASLWYEHIQFADFHDTEKTKKAFAKMINNPIGGDDE